MKYLPLLFESLLLRGCYINHLKPMNNNNNNNNNTKSNSPNTTTTTNDHITAIDNNNNNDIDATTVRQHPAMQILNTLLNPNDNTSCIMVSRHLTVYDKQMFLPEANVALTVDAIFNSGVREEFYALYGKDILSAPLRNYIHQLMQHLKAGAEVYVMALVLVHRVAAAIPVCGLSVHRMFLAAAVICAKSRTDKRIGMSFFAEAGGVAKDDLIEMEAAMMAALGFDIGVSTAAYVDMVYSLRQHCSYLAYARRQEWAAAAWAELVECLPIPSEETLRRELFTEEQFAKKRNSNLSLLKSIYEMESSFSTENAYNKRLINAVSSEIISLSSSTTTAYAADAHNSII